MQEIKKNPNTHNISINDATSLHNSSLDRINVRASGFDEPLHAENSKLDPYHLRDTKVKVEISLDFPSPSSMIVCDSQGLSVRINAKYPRSPPQCSNCGKFGHLLYCCPKPFQKKAFHIEGNMSGSFLHSRSKAKEVLVTEDSNAEASCSQQQNFRVVMFYKDTTHVAIEIFKHFGNNLSGFCKFSAFISWLTYFFSSRTWICSFIKKK
ncbi:unnamed protein product [Eruca vesicaria subsp. sativa]|uniref:CCHC-type domain-containing protein n=1 Tax=Eruca vesicaria subsp. sativa TaxID=29727 RepID=A0ABC8JTN5_ERUVS|nr:unnamed protein product [Eruca vesicaria subsp. sativa]